MNPNKKALIAAMCSTLACSSFAQPDGAAALRQRSLAATCAQCHGTDGRAVAGSAVPGLAGMPASRLAEQMKAFKAGTREGSVMPQIAKGFSDAQIDSLAAFYAMPRP